MPLKVILKIECACSRLENQKALSDRVEIERNHEIRNSGITHCNDLAEPSMDRNETVYYLKRINEWKPSIKGISLRMCRLF